MDKIPTLFLVLFLVGCSQTQRTTLPEVARPSDTLPKNVILMIGDGMGLSQVTAAIYSARNKLAFESFTTTGLQKTHCKDELITDSAAGAAAMARGIKANYNSFGTTENSRAPKSILERAEEKGLATGITVTSSLTHATPAAFITYQLFRSMYEEIAGDFLNLEVDYMVGGGKKFFDRRVDDRDLLQEFKNKGYKVMTYLEQEFEDVIVPTDKNFLYFAADGEPLTHMAGRSYFVPACTRGVNYLSRKSPKGFFYLVESSQIDWGCHANEAQVTIDEVLEFSEAIEQMLAFAERDGETLVIVTADHETGGLAINGEEKKRELDIAFTTKTHTASMVPVYAYGPGEKFFTGVYDNTEIFAKIKYALQL